jgi:hypothetical protein
MTIELSHLMQLVAGTRRYLTIGSLPRSIAAHFGCNPGIVYLRHEEAIHIFQGHEDVDGEDLMHMTFAVEKGRYHADPSARNA